MTMGWRPITREGHPDVTGIGPDGRADVEIRLSEVPPDEWARHFVGLYQGFLVRSPADDWPLPEVRGASIFSRPEEGDLSRWTHLMDERIEETNAFYGNTVLPEIHKREAAAAEFKQREQERLDRLRKEAESL
jgi:hypothetical protein